MIEPTPSHVTIEVPARPEYAQVLRSILASVAAGLDFSLERIDDLRMAIGEAGALLLEAAPGARTIRVEADPLNDGLRVEVSIDEELNSWPPPGIEDTLTWRVLSTVAKDVQLRGEDGRAFVRLGLTATSGTRSR